MGRATRAEWAAQLAASGLSAARFAAEHGINAKTLAWWRAELTRSVSDQPRRELATRETASRRAAPLRFIELPEVGDADAIEVVLPSRVVVRVRAGFDSATLERVLDALESRGR